MMYTGIVQTTAQVCNVRHQVGTRRIGLARGATDILADVQTGASVAVDGTCLTVAALGETDIFFDVSARTAEITTLGALREGSLVNVERSHRIGHENGGHSLYGHIEGKACIVGYRRVGRSVRASIQVPQPTIPYIFRKGFIGIHGCSLTVDEIDEAAGVFHVNLIPETLRLTTLGRMRIGSFLNYEIDQTTRTIVDTLTRTLGGYERHGLDRGIGAQHD